jgi:hypothetical protein
MCCVTKPAVHMRGVYFRWNHVSTCSSAVSNTVICLFFRPGVYKYHEEGHHGDEIWYGGANIFGALGKKLTSCKVLAPRILRWLLDSWIICAPTLQTDRKLHETVMIKSISPPTYESFNPFRTFPQLKKIIPCLTR